MNLNLFKAISAIILFVMSVVGCFLPLKIKQISDSLMKVGNAFAGGILIATAMCHMLADANGDLEDGDDSPGMKINKFLNGGDADDAFPLGSFLCILGFFLVVLIEVVLDPHSQDAHHGHGETNKDIEAAGSQASLTGRSFTSNVVKNASVAGFAALVALLVHSCIEGLASGATSDPDQAFAITLAIMCHKFFAAFGLGSSLLPLKEEGRTVAWLASNLAFCAATPLCMGIGAALEAGLEGTAVAVVTALAAGSLLAVGINEMLIPSLANANHPVLNCVVAILAACAMGMLAAWA
jgi:zinc transporter ZupT